MFPLYQDLVYSEDSLSNFIRYPLVCVPIFIKGQRAGCKEPGPFPSKPNGKRWAPGMVREINSLLHGLTSPKQTLICVSLWLYLNWPLGFGNSSANVGTEIVLCPGGSGPKFSTPESTSGSQWPRFLHPRILDRLFHVVSYPRSLLFFNFSTPFSTSIPLALPLPPTLLRPARPAH